MAEKISEADIKTVDIDSIQLAPYNPRMIDKKEFQKLKNSLTEYGYVQPIIVNKNTGYVVGGNQRLKALKELGYKKVQIVEVDLSEKKEKTLNVVLNKVSGDWDFDKLRELMEDLDENNVELTETGFDMKELKELMGDEFFGDGEENPYTNTINIPQYEITGEPTEIGDLVDESKVSELVGEIMNSTLSEPEKEFLIKAAYRHFVFDYRNIAEFYAKASPEMQRLMEKSALVIIDFNDAIANGYTELDSLVSDLKEEDDNGD